MTLTFFKQFTMVMWACLTLTSLGARAGVSSCPTGGIFAFGDSLSDGGNYFIISNAISSGTHVVPNPLSYQKGRFSNGPTAVEYFVNDLCNLSNLTNFPDNWLLRPSRDPSANPAYLNFAVGNSETGVLTTTLAGTQVPGFKGQVIEFANKLNGARAPATALYFDWTGANNYLVPFVKGIILNVPPTFPKPKDVVEDIAEGVTMQYFLGAKKIIVANLPDLGNIPLTVGTNVSATLHNLTLKHNSLLSDRLDNLSSKLPGIKIIKVDIYGLGNKVINNAVLFAGSGAYNPVVTNCLLSPDPSTCSDQSLYFFPYNFNPFDNNKPEAGKGYVFWDEMHITTENHYRIAKCIESTLKQQPCTN